MPEVTKEISRKLKVFITKSLDASKLKHLLAKLDQQQRPADIIQHTAHRTTSEEKEVEVARPCVQTAIQLPH